MRSHKKGITLVKKYLSMFSALVASLAFLGCSTAASVPAVGDKAVLTGTVVLKGSEPMTTVVLVQADKAQWELQGVLPKSVDDLQNKTVTAEGTVLRATLSGMLLPSLKVTKLTPTAVVKYDSSK